jgi:hypothetical protein
MKTGTLTLSNLHLLSESLDDDFRQQLEAAVIDCRQRPSLAERREVTLKMVITPDPEDPDNVIIEPVTTRKTPARKIMPIKGRRTPKNQIQFDFEPEE